MRIPLAGILMILLPALTTYAKAGNKPDLKLSATIENVDAERQPVLVIHIVNQSGHALHLPEPPLLCKTVPGALSLDVKFVPENNSPPPAPVDCGLEVDGSGLPDIRERAPDHHLVLAPPGAVAVEIERADAVFLEPAAGGASTR